MDTTSSEGHRTQEPTSAPDDPQPHGVARKIQGRAQRRHRILHEVGAVYAELGSALGRVPKLEEVREALFERRKVKRATRTLSLDLDALDLPRRASGQARTSKRRRRLAEPAELPYRLPAEELEVMGIKALLKLARRARWHGRRELFEQVLARIPEYRRNRLSACLARPTPWES